MCVYKYHSHCKVRRMSESVAFEKFQSPIKFQDIRMCACVCVCTGITRIEKSGTCQSGAFEKFQSPIKFQYVRMCVCVCVYRYYSH